MWEKACTSTGAFKVEQGSLEAGEELQSPKGALLRFTISQY